MQYAKLERTLQKYVLETDMSVDAYRIGSALNGTRIRLLKTEGDLLCLNTQAVPRSKHS